MHIVPLCISSPLEQLCRDIDAALLRTWPLSRTLCILSMSWLLIDSLAALGTVGPTHSQQANTLHHLPKVPEVSSGRSRT